MLITEYNEQKEFAKERQEGRNEMAEEIAATMLDDGYAISEVVKISKFPESRVRAIANKRKQSAMA